MWPLLWVVRCWALKHARKKRQWQFKECQGDKYVTLNIVKWGKTTQHHSSQLLIHHKHSPMANGPALVCPQASWYCIAETLHLGPWVHAGHALFRHHQKGPSWHGWGSPFRRPEPATRRAPDLCTEKMVDLDIPSRELTYPTLGKGKSSSKCHFWGIC